MDELGGADCGKEIERLKSIIDALIEHAESGSCNADSSFSVFEKTAILETEVLNRTADLNRSIDEMKALNKALALTKAKFHAIFNLMPNAVCVTTLEAGIVTDANDRFCESFGVSQELVIGRRTDGPELGLFESERDRRRFVDQLLQHDGAHKDFEAELRVRGGGKRHFMVSCRLLILDEEEYLLSEFADISDYADKVKVMRELAEHDPLTGLPNRLLIFDRLKQAMKLMGRTEGVIAVAYLDLDGFKQVNDRYGHQAGDAVLVETAGRIRACLRATDTVGRLGGDEFVVLLIDVASLRSCEEIFARIVEALDEPFDLEGDRSCAIGVSIGYTVYPADESAPEDLVEHADKALYLVKNSGKNGFKRYAES